jgi:diguanylate cyclase (GGDEF)-like protein
MANKILAITLIASLVIVVLLIGYTLRYCESKKKAPFVELLVSIFLYTLGYLLEITAVSAEAAAAGMMVAYIGASFWGSCYLLFVSEFCEIKIKRRIIYPVLIGIPFAYTILTCTSIAGMHDWVITSYEYVADTAVRHLNIQVTPLAYLIQIFSAGCAAAIAFMLLPKIFAKNAANRANCIILLCGALIPLSMDTLFILGVNFYGVYPTNIAAIIVVILLYYSIARYNLIDVTPIATEAALHSVAEALIIVDPDMNFIKANESAVRLFPPLKSKGKNIAINKIEGWPAELQTPLCEIGADIRFSIGGDKHYNASVNRIAVQKNNTLGYLILIRDITGAVAFTKMLEEIAYTDPLTGIVNRRHFMSAVEPQIERIKRSGTRAYIVLFDIDRFKQVNDTYGHVVGDKALKGVTDRVRDTIRAYDMFGRYGGEEFILFIDDIEEKDILSYIERVRLAICSSPMAFEETALTISASFGIARIIPEKGLDAAIKLADTALYAAKNSGRNNVKINYETTAAALMS